MAKVKVLIEEHLCKEVEIEVDENLTIDERLEEAEEKVMEMYTNEKIVLTADDYNGSTLVEITITVRKAHSFRCGMDSTIHLE